MRRPDVVLVDWRSSKPAAGCNVRWHRASCTFQAIPVERDTTEFFATFFAGALLLVLAAAALCCSWAEGKRWHAKDSRVEAAYKTAVLGVYNLTIYPYNELWIANFLKGGPPPSMLSPDICGRVHPFGVHCDPVGVAEYFYGLTPNTITFDGPLRVVIKQVHLTEFFVSEAQRKAFSTINYFVTDLAGNNPTNATQVGVWRFDEKGRILEFDLWNPLYSTSQRTKYHTPFNSTTYHELLANTTCDRYKRFCLGTNYSEFASEEDCRQFMLAKTMGEPDVFVADNLLCRNQHATLTQLRPEIHCAHVGPTGGKFCVDVPYEANYQQTVFPGTQANDPNRLIAPEQYVAVLS